VFLSEDELAYLTKKKHKKLQIQVLIEQDIEFTVGADGRAVVCRTAVPGYSTSTLDRTGRKIPQSTDEPDWSYLRAKAKKRKERQRLT